MRYKIHASSLAIVAFGVLASCRSEPTGANVPSFLTASLGGSVQGKYVGSGAFRTVPKGSVRFILDSQGVGDSANEGFAFHALSTPTPGEYLIGEIGDGADRAIYWRDEGNVRKIFEGQSGVLRISESTSRRIVGTFQLQATLLHICTIEPGMPAPFLNCEPAQEEASIEVTGSFDAGPLGGDYPGLIPFRG